MPRKILRPWFSNRQTPVTFYKINRRPRAQMSLLGGSPPDAFQHTVDVLTFGEPVETRGRGGSRTWLLGHGEADADAAGPLLVGQIGWLRDEALPLARFDRTRQRWIDDTTAASVGNHAPFLYDGETQRLAVLMHPTFRPNTLAYVFATLLNRGEHRRTAPAVEWDVEPLLDVESFRAWLAETRAVQRVTFVAKLPNPDGLEAFEDVLQRLEQRKASALSETWEARDPERGLQDIDQDRDARQMLAMAEHGYGYVKARGENDTGRRTQYNQKQRVRRDITPPLPATWGEMIGTFIDFALERLRT